MIALVIPCLGKGEVLSSILSGSTSKIKHLAKLKGAP